MDNVNKGSAPRFKDYVLENVYLLLESYNFALSSSPGVNVVFFRDDWWISLQWSDDDDMKAYLSEFIFMIISSEYLEPQELTIRGLSSIPKDKNFFEMTIGGRSIFSDHIRVHDHVIKWKHFPRYWPSVREINRSPVNSFHEGQWRGALMFSLICSWIKGWLNIGEAGDMRRSHGHYDVTVRCAESS